jgi:hypothetical protein
MRFVIFLVLAATFCASVSAQESPEENSPEALARAQQSALRLGKIQWRWGPKMNSTGVSGTLKETSRKSTGKETVVFYRIMTSGLPKDKIYQLFLTSFDLQPKPIMQGIALDESGQAVGKPNDPINLGLIAGKGEPKRFSLISNDGQAKAFFYVTPFPVRGTDQGCSIEELLLLQHAEGVLIEGSGFEPNSAVHMRAFSETELHEADLKADSSGDVSTVLLPYVKGKIDGMGKVTFATPACSPSLTYQWGSHSFQNQ